MLAIFVLSAVFAANSYQSPKEKEALSQEQVYQQVTGVEVQKQKKAENKPAVTPQKELTWKDNPNKCDLKTQYIREDNLECKDKPATVAAKPQPSPAPAPTYAVGCEHYRHLVDDYSWNVDVALQVMRAESGCNPQAANWGDQHNVCTGSFGLFQISCHSGQVFDPVQNVAIAWSKYASRGWQPWGVCTSGIVSCY